MSDSSSVDVLRQNLVALRQDLERLVYGSSSSARSSASASSRQIPEAGVEPVVVPVGDCPVDTEPLDSTQFENIFGVPLERLLPIPKGKPGQPAPIILVDRNNNRCLSKGDLRAYFPDAPPGKPLTVATMLGYLVDRVQADMQSLMKTNPKQVAEILNKLRTKGTTAPPSGSRTPPRSPLSRRSSVTSYSSSFGSEDSDDDPSDSDDRSELTELVRDLQEEETPLEVEDVGESLSRSIFEEAREEVANEPTGSFIGHGPITVLPSPSLSESSSRSDDKPKRLPLPQSVARKIGKSDSLLESLLKVSVMPWTKLQPLFSQGGKLPTTAFILEQIRVAKKSPPFGTLFELLMMYFGQLRMQKLNLDPDEIQSKVPLDELDKFLTTLENDYAIQKEVGRNLFYNRILDFNVEAAEHVLESTKILNILRRMIQDPALKTVNLDVKAQQYFLELKQVIE